MTFIEAVLNGEAFPDEIDAYIETWHNSKGEQPLHEYLGFLWDEYALWVEQPQSLGSILLGRRSGVTTKEFNWDEVHLLAARSQAQQDPIVLKRWLKSRGLL